MKKVYAIVLFVPVILSAQEPRVVEWPYVGGDQAHTKYSTLADITAANVNLLEPVWTWEHGEQPLAEFETRPLRFEATPSHDR